MLTQLTASVSKPVPFLWSHCRFGSAWSRAWRHRRSIQIRFMRECYEFLTLLELKGMKLKIFFGLGNKIYLAGKIQDWLPSLWSHYISKTWLEIDHTWNMQALCVLSIPRCLSRVSCRRHATAEASCSWSPDLCSSWIRFSTYAESLKTTAYILLFRYWHTY